MKSAVFVLSAVLTATSAQAQEDIGLRRDGRRAVTCHRHGGRPSCEACRRDRREGLLRDEEPARWVLPRHRNVRYSKREDSDTVVVPPGGRVSLDVGLFGKFPILEIDWAGPLLALSDLCKKADAVLHVLVTGASPRAALRPQFFTITARVVDAVKRDRQMAPADDIVRTGDTVTFRQECWHDEPAPYTTGEELVLFLSANTSGALTRINGPHAAFRIRNGIVQAPGDYKAYRGMGLDAFLAKLRAWTDSGAPPR